ncbi:PspC domain-containing protein [Terrilactibacillus sp. BCM23-1]|uniref:PspC domain-containing protein n=1 Tax=Terrilactibacillus tamarindi TaxID=2599694 RepID=A0A6N8CQX4_9BACI|nr:PspC domain-containing protein [Terrilactibacillus tamarindi]MTT31587.1 PspC domain-containing protein [Terrilactibacillus tamarindi]
MKKLYKSKKNKMVSGVLGGISDYLNVDATIVRIVYATLTVLTAFFAFIFLYIIAAVIIPSEES